MSNWGLSHKGLRIRSVDQVAVLYLCIRAFQLLQRKGERETDTGFCRVRASGATGSLREALAKTDRLHCPLGKIQL